MPIPRKYDFNDKISSYLTTIEVNKEVINSVRLPVEVEDNIRRQSILGSALFSARIEGNILTKTEVTSFSDLNSNEKNKLEVGNLHRAISTILRDFDLPKTVTSGDVLLFHKITMKSILADDYCGKFRLGHEGVFDSAGNLIYHSPPPGMINDLLKQLLDYINSVNEKYIPIKAVLAHLSFEDIHPFVDGSGRVGRLLQLAVLNMNGYGMKGLVNVEELIDENRILYYNAIEIARENNNASEFVSLMLKFLAEASIKAKNILLQKQNNGSPLDTLLPRRREIVEIIRDQRLVSLDFLHRRFLRVSERLLSYDLKCLIDDGYIIKVGKTRGALYAPKL